jgi:quinol monooxygenase YgiN
MPVTVTIQLMPKETQATLDILARALPITRTYSGCRYVNTFVKTDEPRKIILIQGWDSAAAQAAYINWRQETGDLQQLVATLVEPPLVEFWELDPA